MRLTVGRHTFDLASRALVIGQVDAGREPTPAVHDHIASLVADGADLVAVNGLDDAAQAAAEAAIGSPPLVWLVDDGKTQSPPGPATVLVARTPAAALESGAGDQVVVAVDDLRAASALVDAGFPLLVDATDAGTAAVAVTLGCRLVRTTSVTAVRRVCDVLAAVMEAGS